MAFFILSQDAESTTTLDNGLRVIIKEDHRNPLVVFSAFIDIGSAYEGQYLGSGISHFIEHMLFKGTSKYPAGSIEKILHKYGGRIEGFTSYDYTGYRITLLKDYADIALDILREMLTEPKFDKDELERERQVILREMDLYRDDPARRATRLVYKNAYYNHPYKFPIVGYRENFMRLKRRDLIKFFRENYTPEKTVIAVVGDIDRESMFNKMRSIFEKIPRGGNRLNALPEPYEQIVINYCEDKMDIEGAYLNIAFHSTRLLDKDLYALDLLAFILGQGESSILNKRLRLEKELALSVTAYNYTPKGPGLFVIASVQRQENVKEALREIINEVEAVKKNGVKKEQLERARQNFIAGHLYEKETIQTQANNLAIGELLTGNPHFFDLYIENIRGVTLEDIKRVSQKYLTTDSMTVALVSKSGDTLGSISEVIQEGVTRHIKKINLSNGLRCIISKNPSLPIVAISILFNGGLRFETDETNGISQLLSRLLTDGTNSMSREDIADFYESKGMSLSSYSADNSLGITITCLKEYTEDAFKLLSEVLLNPMFSEDELKKEKSELHAAIDMQDNHLFNQGHRLLKKLLFKRHPYRFDTIGTHESIKKIEREDIVRFYKTILLAENMVLGISGDCDIGKIQRWAEKYFAEIPSGKVNIALPEREPPAKKKTRLEQITEKSQSLVLLGFQSVDVYDKDRYAIEVMVDMLSSESGILFKSIREKKGLAYATGAFQVAGVDPGYIGLYALTSKEQIPEIEKIMFRELTRFVKRGASDEEIERSKNHLKAMRQMNIQTNSSFIFTVSLDELYGLGYDNYKDYEKNIDAVTTGDIKKAAERYLRLDRSCEVVLVGSGEGGHHD